MPTPDKTFMVEDAQLLFRNFSGEASNFNKAGDRNFCCVLDEKTAELMARDGWNIKYLKPREEGDEATPYIKITVKYKVKPPKIFMLTTTGRTMLSEDTVGVLDWADLLKVDLLCRAYDWDVNGKTGITAYLQTMFATIQEDPLEQKYALLEMER